MNKATIKISSQLYKEIHSEIIKYISGVFFIHAIRYKEFDDIYEILVESDQIIETKEGFKYPEILITCEVKGVYKKYTWGYIRQYENDLHI